MVRLTATPAGDYAFTGWGGDASGTSNPLSVVMDGDKSITASFQGPPPSCETWSLLNVAAGPGSRVGAAAVWDPVRHRMVMFGGYDGANFLAEVWVLDSSPLQWTQLAPAGTRESQLAPLG